MIFIFGAILFGLFLGWGELMAYFDSWPETKFKKVSGSIIGTLFCVPALICFGFSLPIMAVGVFTLPFEIYNLVVYIINY